LNCRLQIEGVLEIAEFCREIETYLCKKNDGHLIRVVGPSFELVSGWAQRGVPLKVACSGIDRCFERYYRQGPRRRPVKIDFCEADVLDVFDEWRRAVGIRGAGGEDGREDGREEGHSTSLPLHLQRAVARLSSARASGLIGPEFDALIDRLSAELDAARAKAGGLRGTARALLLARLEQTDEDMLSTAARALDGQSMQAIVAEADAELSSFRERMTAEELARAHRAAVSSQIRRRLQLPILRFG
jgi:hypothetical protein